MPCLFNGCAGNCANTINWNIGNLCAAHYNQLAALYPVTDTTLQADFVKVHALLQLNVTLCKLKLCDLHDECVRAQANPLAVDPRFDAGDAGYVKMSRLLEYYEGFCWFPANRSALAGLLSTPAFNGSLKLGLNKDPGAGRAHGEQSHRIQWHVIMRLMTSGFTTAVFGAAGWSRTPLQLFYDFTQGPGAAVVAWGRAMDSQGNPGWGNPDNVALDILGDNNLPLFRDAINRRVQKMGGPNALTLSPRDQAFQNALLALWVGSGPAAEGKSAMVVFEDVVKQIYAWEKTQLPGKPPKNGLENLAWNVYFRTRGERSDLFTTARSKDYSEYKKNLLVKDDAPDKLVVIDKKRVARSQAGFNTTQYGYSVLTGAFPTPGRQ